MNGKSDQDYGSKGFVFMLLCKVIRNDRLLNLLNNK
jgi:hypothetical protein